MKKERHKRKNNNNCRTMIMISKKYKRKIVEQERKEEDEKVEGRNWIRENSKATKTRMIEKEKIVGCFFIFMKTNLLLMDKCRNLSAWKFVVVMVEIGREN